MNSVKNVLIGGIYLRGGVYHLALEEVSSVKNGLYWCSVHRGYDIDSLISVTDYASVHLQSECYQLVGNVTSDQHNFALENFKGFQAQYRQSLSDVQQPCKKKGVIVKMYPR